MARDVCKKGVGTNLEHKMPQICLEVTQCSEGKFVYKVRTSFVCKSCTEGGIITAKAKDNEK